MNDALAALKAAKGYVPPDGIGRDPERQRQLNSAFLECFETPSGQVVLALLRQLTTPLSCGFNDAMVRERNAMAWMLWVIEQRIEHGRHGLPRPE